MTGAIDEDGEQVEGLVRERNANAVAPERPAGQVEPERRKIFHVTRAIVTETGRAATFCRLPGLKSYRNPTGATIGGDPTGLLP